MTLGNYKQFQPDEWDELTNRIINWPKKISVIPVFRGAKKTCIEGCARPRKDRNLSSGAVWEGQPTLALLFF